MIIKDLFISFWQLTTKVIFSKRPQVLFYYPQHFNRSAEGTNPFFDPMLKECEKHDIPFVLIEEPDYSSDKPRNKKAIKGDALFLMIVVLRKIIGIIHSESKFYVNEQRVAIVLSALTLGKLIIPRYVSISGSMNELFIYLNPKGEIYEMQHGVVFAGKDAFYEPDGSLHPAYQSSNFHLMFWGKGYQKSVIRGHENEWEGRTHVIGYPLDNGTAISKIHEDANTILFSMQITMDANEEWANGFLEMVEDCLKQLHELIIKGFKFKVLLKHHPRFNNAYNIDYLFDKYPFVELTDRPLSELLPNTMLQVTYHSTTAFEYGQFGVPSFFMQSKKMKQGVELFYDEYNYPLYKNLAISEVVERLQDENLRNHDAEVVRKWYREFYDEFNEDKFIKVIDN